MGNTKLANPAPLGLMGFGMTRSPSGPAVPD